MSDWLRKIRGLGGVGLAGTIAGGLFGGLFALTSNAFGFFNHFGTLWSSVIFLALFGGVSSTALGLSIPLLARSERISELSPLISGLIGALAGVAATLILVVEIRGTVAVKGIGLVAAITGVFCGALTAGMVAIAGSAERRELEVEMSAPERMIDLPGHPRREGHQ